MNIKLQISGHTDRTVRFHVIINDQDTGELQTQKIELVELAHKLFETYTISNA